FRLNGASLFGLLKVNLLKKKVKIGTNTLILFVDSHFLLLYSHRYIEGRSTYGQATPRKLKKKEETKTYTKRDRKDYM
ncbi:MAG: hypothetical protein AB7E77_02605, partial [Desulfobulbus sp.]